MKKCMRKFPIYNRVYKLLIYGLRQGPTSFSMREVKLERNFLPEPLWTDGGGV